MKKEEVKSGKEEFLYKGKELSLKVVPWQAGPKKGRKEVVIYPDTVGTLPLIGENKVVLVRQHRFPAKKQLWEIPAGKLDKGEKPKEGAARELREETGMKAGSLERLGGFFVSPGYTTEYITLFLARDLEEGEQFLDKNEVINTIETFSLQEVWEMIREGKIIDGKTILAIALQEFDYHFSEK